MTRRQSLSLSESRRPGDALPRMERVLYRRNKAPGSLYAPVHAEWMPESQ